MTAEVSREQPKVLDPDALEVAPGTKHENLEGWVPEMATQQEIFDAFDKAFDYRGDVTLTLKDGSKIDGYIFDRKTGKSLDDSVVRLFPVNADEKRSVKYADIARLEFTGKDRAAGKHWESWVKQYNEKKARGEKNIALHPEALD
jgi:hypothetical protein